MLVIGLTGGIGSGKSTVADRFAEHGVPIIDADLIAKELTLPDEPAFKAIVEHFGSSFVSKDGTLDRRKLREHIFNHVDERNWLEGCLHPLIVARMKEQIGLLKGAPYCIAVIPLLAESQAFPFIGRILVVDLPEEDQVERVLNRDKTNAAQVKAIIESQASRHDRLAIAHDVITNNGSLDDLITQVDALHKKYVNMAI